MIAIDWIFFGIFRHRVYLINVIFCTIMGKSFNLIVFELWNKAIKCRAHYCHLCRMFSVLILLLVAVVTNNRLNLSPRERERESTVKWCSMSNNNWQFNFIFIQFLFICFFCSARSFVRIFSVLLRCCFFIHFVWFWCWCCCCSLLVTWTDVNITAARVKRSTG